MPLTSNFRMEITSPRNSVNRPPTPEDTVEEQGDQEKQPTLQEIIKIKLIEIGEKERLMELLRERLIECGWKDEMKALCSYDRMDAEFVQEVLPSPSKVL
ncbi:hypothetical protein NC651_036748 [Populus alba x Populus x berolinensis]|nr:hypothetical protein NC651_036748 [Populus alba x Populus x berolinensis]